MYIPVRTRLSLSNNVSRCDLYIISSAIYYTFPYTPLIRMYQPFIVIDVNVSPQLALPMLIRLVDTMINSKLRFGYDIGKGFVVGVEEMLQQFDRFGSILHQSIAKELHRRTEESRLDVIRSLGGDNIIQM